MESYNLYTHNSQLVSESGEIIIIYDSVVVIHYDLVCKQDIVGIMNSLDNILFTKMFISGKDNVYLDISSDFLEGF